MKYKKNAILYGVGEIFDTLYYAIRACYNIVAVTDSDLNKKGKVEKLGEKFIAKNDIMAFDFDCIFVTPACYNEIFAFLAYELNVEKSKILKMSDLLLENTFSLGELNPEKTFYVIRAVSPNAGLFALFNSRIIATLEVIDGQNYDIFMDFQNYRNVYHKESTLGKDNIWEYYFKQPCCEKTENVYKSKNVILGLHLLRKDKYNQDNRVISGLPCKSNVNHAWYFTNWLRQINRELYKKYIILNDDMQMRIEAEYCRIFLPLKESGKKICGVFYRGTDYTKLKTYGHEIQPTIEQTIEKARQMMTEWGFDYVYFDSEDESAFQTFCDAFPGNVIYSERARIKEYSAEEIVNVKFDRENDEFLKGMEYIRSCYLMARCDFFISGMFAGSVAVHFITEGFENSFMFELGVYGIDDDSYCWTPDGKPIYINKKE